VANEFARRESEILKAAQLVLKVGTDVNAIDANGDTATHAAVLKNLSTVVQVQADPRAKFDLWNRRNWHDWTLFPIDEGHRPDHFKPSEETIVAVREVLLTAGVVPLAEGPGEAWSSGLVSSSAQASVRSLAGRVNRTPFY